MLRPYSFSPSHPLSGRQGRPTVRLYQLNIYLTPSCIRQTSNVLTFFWNEREIRLRPTFAIVYVGAPVASTPEEDRGRCVTNPCDTPQSLFSRFVKLRMSNRICRLFAFPPRRRETSCEMLRSARNTIGRKTALRSAYWPRWLLK